MAKKSTKIDVDKFFEETNNWMDQLNKHFDNMPNLDLTTVKDEVKSKPEDLKRITELEEIIKKSGLKVPDLPDPNLKADEWWAIFPNFQDLTTGTLTKKPWGGGSNMTSTFKVKRIP